MPGIKVMCASCHAKVLKKKTVRSKFTGDRYCYGCVLGGASDALTTRKP